MIITISGLDGAGKSTQINRLTKRLVNDGRKVRYVWARGGYTPGFEFIKICLRRLPGMKLPPQGHSTARKKKFGNPFIQKIWLIVAILDLLFLWGLYVRILSFFNISVLCDRYLNDTLLDFRQNFPMVDVEKSFLWKWLRFLTPEADCAFVFWVPVEISKKRSLEKGEPFPDSGEVLEWRLEFYMDELFFPLDKYHRVDGRGEISKVTDKLYELIIKNFNRDSIL
jgi:thymidylate kinase